MIALLAGGVAIGHTSIHAQQIDHPQVTQSTSNIEQQSKDVHQKLLMNNKNSSLNINNNKTRSNNVVSGIKINKKDSDQQSNKGKPAEINIDYMYHKNSIGNYKYQGFTDTNPGENVDSDIKNNVPKGYTLSTDSYLPEDLTITGTNGNVRVHKLNTDNINLSYQGKTINVHSYSGPSDSSDSLLHSLYSQAIHNHKLSFTVYNSNPYGMDKYESNDWQNLVNQLDKIYTNDPKHYTCKDFDITLSANKIQPKKKMLTDTFNYMYDNKIIDSVTKIVSDTLYNRNESQSYKSLIDSSNKLSSYLNTNQDINGNDRFTYNNSTHNIVLLNKDATSKMNISYTYNNKSVGNYSISGKVGTPIGINSANEINHHVPNGYTSNIYSGDKKFSIKDESVNIPVQKRLNDTINLNFNGKIVKTYNFKGIEGESDPMIRTSLDKIYSHMPLQFTVSDKSGITNYQSTEQQKILDQIDNIYGNDPVRYKIKGITLNIPVTKVNRHNLPNNLTSSEVTYANQISSYGNSINNIINTSQTSSANTFANNNGGGIGSLINNYDKIIDEHNPSDVFAEIMDPDDAYISQILNSSTANSISNDVNIVSSAISGKVSVASNASASSSASTTNSYENMAQSIADNVNNSANTFYASEIAQLNNSSSNTANNVNPYEFSSLENKVNSLESRPTNNSITSNNSTDKKVNSLENDVETLKSELNHKHKKHSSKKSNNKIYISKLSKWRRNKINRIKYLRHLNNNKIRKSKHYLKHRRSSKSNCRYLNRLIKINKTYNKKIHDLHYRINKGSYIKKHFRKANYHKFKARRFYFLR